MKDSFHGEIEPGAAVSGRSRARSFSSNLSFAGHSAMASAAKQAGLGLSQERLGGDVILWECSEGSGELTAEEAAALGERIRLGASLLLTLDRHPGTTPMRMAFVSPTSAFETQTHFDDLALPGELAAASWDASMFGTGAPQAIAVPFHYQIRPLATVERGQAKYERYRRPIQHLKDTVLGPNDDFWSKSLLNREHLVRVRGGDMFQSPLLVTGLYGAGRVAVFASTSAALDASERGAEFWAKVLGWLAETGTVTDESQRVVPGLAIETQNHSVRLQISNPSESPLTVQVVARAFTWEGALLGAHEDGVGGELQQAITLAPRASVGVDVPLPPPSAMSYQALDAADAFQLRAGVLSGSGASLLLQKRVAIDFRPPVKLAVRTDNLDTIPYPFHAPGLGSLPLFNQRMGAFVGAYSYAPGGQVAAEVSISNGVSNLAPLARVADETSVSRLPAPGESSNSPAVRSSVEALNDNASIAYKGTSDGVEGHGAWKGQGGESVLSFTFGHPVTLCGVTLLGSDDDKSEVNPDAVSIDLDGRKIASSGVLGADLISGQGQARIAFAPASGSKLTLRLTQNALKKDKKPRFMSLGEVLLEGWSGDAPAPSNGILSVTLVDAQTGSRTELTSKELKLAGGAQEQVKVKFSIPAPTGAEDAPQFFRVEAVYRDQAAKPNEVKADAPLMALRPPKPLLPRTDLRPTTAPSLGLIVSRGFRDCIPLGTGTLETIGGWGQPDDVIWCHAHQFNEISAHAKSQASRLYLSEVTMGHYISPWRHFTNGVGFYDVATENIVAKMKAEPSWSKSDRAFLSHSDRWNAGPDLSTLHSWSDFLAFDDHLRESGKPGLTGRTRSQVAAEIHEQHEDDWQAYQLAQYVANVRMLREGFKAEGKDLVISSQGVPMVAGPAGEELSKTIRGMSDDSTWGMEHNNIPATTGRQLSELAHNPVWQMNTLLQWGYDSSNLGNPIWHAPVGTTESSRRHCYDRAWRATIWPDGSYGSMHTYGYNSNASVSFLMTENDWQQWWLLQERHSLLTPEEPIGAGLVISSSRYAGPEHVRFTAAGNTFAESPEAQTLSITFQRLHEAGLSMPFSANAGALAGWKGSAPLIILNLADFDPAEVATLERHRARGIRMVALTEEENLPPAAAALFARPGATILAVPARVSEAQARTIVPQLLELLDMPLHLPEGTAGYGFRMSGTSFIVVEDWLERGRTTHVRLRASAHASRATAANVNDHVSVPVRRDGQDWVLEATLRPGDGTLFAIKEEV